MTVMLEAVGLRVRYGGVDVVRGVDLTLTAGKVTGLIGPNGAGKTSVVDALMGFVPMAGGDVRVDGHSIATLSPHRRVALGVARTFQTVELFDDLTVAENLRVADEAHAGARSVATIDTLPRDVATTTVAAELSPSRRKSVALARALATRPRVLLLDEPAAGLDRSERIELARQIRDIAAAGIAVLLVDHDLRLVLDVCDEVAVLDLGTVVFTGTPAALRADAGVAATYLGERLDVSRRDRPVTRGTARPAVTTHALHAGYGEMTVLDDIDLRIDEGEIVALLGPNGAGKTTLLLALAGALSHVEGGIEVLGRPLPRRAHRLARRGVASILQDRKVFAELTVADNLRLAARHRDVSAAVARFPALSPMLGKRAGALSGGEQQLVALARAVARNPRLLLVDELSLGLSAAAIDDLLGTLVELRDETGAAIVFAEQHAHHALAIADRAYVLAAGRVVLEGPARDLAADPDRVTAAYLGQPQ